MIAIIGTLIILTFCIYTFGYNTDLHFIFVQSHYIFIIALVLTYRKALFPSLAVLIIGHVLSDYIELNVFPLQALTESIVQTATAIMLFLIVKQREKQSLIYEQVIKASQIGTWQWNVVTGECIYNERWANICGYTLEELKPLNINTWLKLAHPDDNKGSEEKLQAMFDGKTEYYDHRIRMKHKEGHWIWVHDRGKVITRTKDHKPLIVSGTHTEVTHEVELQNSAQYMHDLMAYVIKHSPSAIAVHDKDLNYVYVSQKYLDIYEVRDPNVIGKNHYEVFPEIPEKWRLVHQRSLRGEIIRGDRDPFVRPDGHIDITRWESRPWYDEKGEVAGIIIYTDIINEQIRREQDLENSRQVLQDVMDNLPIGIAVNSFKPTVNFTYMNDNFYKIHQTTKEFLMKPDAVWEVLAENPETRDRFRKRVLQDIESNDPNRMKWRDIPIRKNGEKTRYLDAYVTKIKHANLYITTVIDVTEQKLREDEIRYISYQDFGTSIPNRRFFTEQLRKMDQLKLYPLSLFIMDINGLKLLNDAFGHEKGNEALQTIANILNQTKREGDVIARIGGDEFAMIMPKTTHDEAEKIKNRIHELVAQQNINDVQYSISIGMSVKKDVKQNISDIMKLAEEDMYRKKVLEGQSVRNRAILGILSMLTDKYQEEKIHSERVSEFCQKMGEALKLNKEDIDELKMAGMLHDIGKVSIPDSILDKPGKLTAEEWVIMKEHTIYGYNILKAADQYSNLALYALSHHERYDGKGYPQGISGNDIPLYSRVIGVVDAYEAMTADRVYRKALSSEIAVAELIRCAGTQFDPEIVDLFIDNCIG
jgi:diguanylate cyclase (GGDEF)-like protein/PAS domain S-box-containing protein